MMWHSSIGPISFLDKVSDSDAPANTSFLLLHIPKLRTNLKQNPPKSETLWHLSTCRKMASITLTASFLSTTSLTKGSPRIAHRRLVVVNAAKGAEVESIKLSGDTKRESNNGRRELMFAAAAAAVCSVAGIAAAEAPKPGTKEAKKFYAPVCVTMPTAKICHK